MYTPEELRQIGEQVTDEMRPQYVAIYKKKEEEGASDVDSYDIVVHRFAWNVSFISVCPGIFNYH